MKHQSHTDFFDTHFISEILASVAVNIYDKQVTPLLGEWFKLLHKFVLISFVKVSNHYSVACKVYQLNKLRLAMGLVHFLQFANQKLKVNVCPNLIVKRASTSEPDHTLVICNLDKLSLIKSGKLADSEN